jgi:protein tyrosine phosphatase
MEDFGTLLEHFMSMLLNSQSTEKSVIHCSAGIGRTGTTAALAHLIISISSQVNSGVSDAEFSVFSTVRRLRE